MTGKAGTGEAVGAEVAVGTEVEAGTAVPAGTAVEAGVGTAVGVRAGTAVGTKPAVGTTMAGISAGTSTAGVVRGGEKRSPRLNSSTAGLAQALSVAARAGGIGAMPGLGTILVGDGA